MVKRGRGRKVGLVKRRKMYITADHSKAAQTANGDSMWPRDDVLGGQFRQVVVNAQYGTESSLLPLSTVLRSPKSGTEPLPDIKETPALSDIEPCVSF
jgi:hypothetical protein